MGHTHLVGMSTTTSMTTLSTFLFFILIGCQARQVLHGRSNWNKAQQGNPGVKIRLTQKGINHMKTVGVKLLNEQFSQPGLQGNCDLTNVRVKQYKPPQVSIAYLLPPRSVQLGLQDMDITLEGLFDATAGLFRVNGAVEGTLEGMSIAITTDFISTPDGQIAVQVVNCSTVIYRSHFNINPYGPLGPLIKTLEAFINEQVRGRIPTMFCSRLKHLIEENSPRIFARLTRTNFEDHFKGDFTDKEVIKGFIANFVRGLFVDNRNIAQPLVTNDFFESQHRGEIRYLYNNEPTPFYPTIMNTTPDSDRMLYFYASDYLFNSLLYHAYQTNKLTIELNKNNLPREYQGLVSTTCNGGGGFASAVCVGKLIPAIAEAYPNTTTSFVLIPHGLPDFAFNGESGAIRLSSRILTYVDDRGHPKQIMVSSADGQADIMLSAAEGKLSGELKLNKLNVRLHRSTVPVEPTSIEQLTPLAKTFIGPQLNQAIKKGMPFPLNGTITFVEPKIKIQEGFVELGTDFILGEEALRQKIRETFAEIMF